MNATLTCRLAAVWCVLAAVALPAHARAQGVESLGTRALGMAGAFVAVADDATAVYWNPAGVAGGPFLEIRFDRSRLDAFVPAVAATGEAARGRRTVATFAGLTVPPLGLSYVGLRTGQITSTSPAVEGGDDREHDRPSGSVLSALATDHVGVTLVQSLSDGLVVAATLRGLQGRASRGAVPADLAASDLLDRADELPGATRRTFDVDVGVLARAGNARIGLVVRNLREPAFEAGRDDPDPIRLDRQVRAGVSYIPGGGAMTLALDVDLTGSRLLTGHRRNVAFGADRWFRERRLAVRGGVRASTVGAARPVAAGGGSVALRQGLFLDVQVTRGGEEADRGWSLAGRMTF